MGSSNSTAMPETKDNGECKMTNEPEEKKKLKPCCACPETKIPRDECIVQKGEEHCQEFIEAHKQCMRAAGFNI